MKHLKTALFSSLLAAGLLCGTIGFHAAAYTVDEVAQKAREAGYSEEQVQRGYNEWNTGIYTQEDLDQAYEALCGYQSNVDSKIDSIFDNGSSQSTVSSAAESADSSAVSAPDRIPSAEFISMTLDEKIAYVNSLPAAEKDAFLNGLSAAERNSIIKQMSVSDKADIMQGYVDAASAMGMNMVVDSLSENGVSVTVRDKDGVIIDKASVGVTIDETGISHTRLFALAGAAIALACAGLGWLYRRLRA